LKAQLMSKPRTIVIVGASFAGIKAAWDLRRELSHEHEILLFSNYAETIIRASFPRVIFEDVPLADMTIDLASNFAGTGIQFVHDPLVRVDQDANAIVTERGRYDYDYLVLATGARHAYEALPGSREFAKCICDRERILETKEAILNFQGGVFYGGVGAGYTPCDGPPMEIIMDLDYRLRELGVRDNAELHYVTDKSRLLPPGGPPVWSYLGELFRRRDVHVHVNTELVRLDEKQLHFGDGSVAPYDLCVIVPPFRGIRALEDSGLTDARGFVPVSLQTMRADQSKLFNVYAVGDAIAYAGPKQGHLALMQAAVAAAHIAWRINRTGVVPSFLPEFKCVMDLGGGNGLYMYSQWLSDGDVIDIEEGPAPYRSKIRFEELFYELRGNIGDLHLQMVK
jgi:sulfide:quinone oxidoreductase